jgi:glycosyltransferase involved in cell wall biosynthesis
VSAACSRRAASRAAAIVVCSEELRRALPRAEDRARAHVIAAGVDLALFAPMNRDEARRRLGWSTGPVVLFGAWRARAVKRFWLAEQAVRGLADLGVVARLESLENVLPEDVPLYLNAADCLLLTSRHEGSPNVVKEAAACGCPVVSVPVGDVSEVLDGVTPGAVVPADPAALAAALRGVLRDGRRSDGRARIAARHAAPDVAARVAEVYRGAVGAGRGRGPQR